MKTTIKIQKHTKGKTYHVFLLPSMLSRNVATLVISCLFSLSWIFNQWDFNPQTLIKHFTPHMSAHTVLKMNMGRNEVKRTKWHIFCIKQCNLMNIDCSLIIRQFTHFNIWASGHHALPTITSWTIQTAIFYNRKGWNKIEKHPSSQFSIKPSTMPSITSHIHISGAVVKAHCVIVVGYVDF